MRGREGQQQAQDVCLVMLDDSDRVLLSEQSGPLVVPLAKPF